MSYVDQPVSGNRTAALIVVAILHVVFGYALVTGLAYEGAKKILKRVTTIDIEEEVKKEEPPPPPKKLDIKPPVVVPPPKVNIAITPPQIEQVVKPPPPPPPPAIVPPPPVPPPPPPKPASPRGDPSSWATSADYPSRALREERSGTTGFAVTIDADGKVATCRVTSSSGHADLDEATCKNVTRRARFRKPSDGYGNTYSNRIRWVIPD